MACLINSDRSFLRDSVTLWPMFASFSNLLVITRFIPESRRQILQLITYL